MSLLQQEGPMHLVSDPEKHEEAIRKKFPFFRTACGTAVPNTSLTRDPSRVDCVLCMRLIDQMMQSEPQPAPPDVAPVSPATDFEVDEDLLEGIDNPFDLDTASDSLPETLQPSSEASEDDEEPKSLLERLDEVKEIVDELMPMLSMFTAGFEMETDWKQWVTKSGEIGDSLEDVVSPSDLDMLRTLYDFASPFGLDPLFEIFASILHRTAMKQVPSSNTDVDEDGDE